MASLALRLQKSSYTPAETMTAAVRLQTDRELRMRAGQVRLVYINRHVVRQQDTDSADDETHAPAVEVAAQRFAGEETIPAGSEREWTISLSIPYNAPASADLRDAGIAWRVRADLDVHGPDIHAEAEFVTLSPLSAETRSAVKAHPEIWEAGACSFEVTLPSRSFLAGEEIAGSVVLTARKSMKASEVVVTLVRRLQLSDRSTTNTRRPFIADSVRVSGPLRLTAGAHQEFPFTLRLPPDACPSLEARYCTVWWGIDCSAPHWFRSRSITHPITVYNLLVQ